MRFISVHSRAPQEPEDKIVSIYKRKLKQPWIGCVVGQRLQGIMTFEMVTCILVTVSERRGLGYGWVSEEESFGQHNIFFHKFIQKNTHSIYITYIIYMLQNEWNIYYCNILI